MTRAWTLEIAVWAVLALLSAGAMLTYKPIPLTNDGIVYLNVAEEIREGRGISTTIVHYDTERSHGRIPAPMTTFPPGYPFVISVWGGSESSARYISLVSFTGTAALLTWALLFVDVPELLRLLVMLGFLTNVMSLRYATSVHSEGLFTFLAFASLVGILWTERTEDSLGIVLSCLAISVAYTVRYAGLFLIPLVVTYALVGKRRQILSALIPLFTAAALFVRNSMIVGDWRGGNDMPISKPLRSVLGDYARGEIHLLFGAHRFQLGVWEALLVAASIVVAGWIVTYLVPMMQRRERLADWRVVGIILVWILLYTSAFVFAARTSVVDVDSRMFVPLVPCYLLVLALLLTSWRQSKILMGGLAAIVVCTAAINARDLSIPDPRTRPLVLADLMAKPASDGRSLRQWIDANIGVNEAIVAADGQATAHLLGRPTVSMVPADFSMVRWECGEIRKQMERFQARYLILYKAFPPGSPENDDFLVEKSRFIGGTAEQQQACGFMVAEENSGVRVLRINTGYNPAVGETPTIWTPKQSP